MRTKVLLPVLLPLEALQLLFAGAAGFTLGRCRVWTRAAKEGCRRRGKVEVTCTYFEITCYNTEHGIITSA